MNASKNPVLFVSHEASRTGAPLILLNLLKELSNHYDMELFGIFVRGGPLLSEFSHVAHTISGRQVRPDVLRRGLRSLRILPALGLINTACVVGYGEVFRSCRIPLVTFVHELAADFEPERFRSIYATSDKVVFPAEFVMRSVNDRAAVPPEKGVIIPQGLLKPGFGMALSKDVARERVCRELGIEPESHIVMGCGVVEPRKGTDWFVAAAKRILEAKKKAFHFVWVGYCGALHASDFFRWCLREVRAAGLTNRVHFIGEKEDPEPYFLAADVFLLSSRGDPFPCVVHEAMSARLPVVAFEGAGGAPEALRDGCGIVVPFGDADAAAEAILDLAARRELRESIANRAFERVRTRYVFAKYGAEVASLIENEVGVPLPKRGTQGTELTVDFTSPS